MSSSVTKISGKSRDMFIVLQYWDEPLALKTTFDIEEAYTAMVRYTMKNEKAWQEVREGFLVDGGVDLSNATETEVIEAVKNDENCVFADLSPYSIDTVASGTLYNFSETFYNQQWNPYNMWRLLGSVMTGIEVDDLLDV